MVEKKVNCMKKQIIEVLKRYGIRRAGLFGSYARGEQDESSDVDILASVPKKVSLYEFIGIKQDLEDALGKNVDLVEYDYIRPELRERILQEEVRII